VASALAVAAGVPPIIPDDAVRPVRGTAVPPPRSPVRSLRLRAGLRLAAALRLGAARPLGGGLFAAGRLVPRVLFGRAPRRAHAAVITPSGPRRVQAALVTLLLGLVAGLSWASAREPSEAGPAQAAAAGSGPIPSAARGACAVTYQVRYDSGSEFEARLTVLNAGPHAMTGWRLEFRYPGAQRLAHARGVVQRGRTVSLRARSNARLNAGRSFTMTLRGGYRDANPLPLAFALDGRRCSARLIGATTGSGVGGEDRDGSRVTGAAGVRVTTRHR
jgi:serine/threonine-protein kinase